MTRETLLRSAICAAFVGFVFCLGAQAARAQNVQPFVDCVERERDSTGALTGKYTAYFGYINLGSAATFIPNNSAGNFTIPIRNPPGQPSNFQPGVHPRAFSITLDTSISETWRLSTYGVTASFTNSRLCENYDDGNSRLTTYQGRLSDGAAAANGNYDLQFQLFDAATGGTAQTELILLKNIQVTNGIFTVPLYLGRNQAILEGADVFLEIGVRPANSTGAFTILTPRQPLTAAPYAIRSIAAQRAVRAAFADGGSNNFRVVGDAFVSSDSSAYPSTGGNLTVDGNLTVRGTISGTVTNATNATNVFGGIVQLPLTSGTPPATECDASSEYGRQKVDASNLRLYICTAAGWKSTALQ